MNYRSMLLLVITLIIPGCCKVVPTASILDQKINEAPPVTIWLHGTCPPLPEKISICVKGYLGFYHYLIAKPHRIYRIAQRIINSDPKQFDAREFYIYGWSGKLSCDEREKAARHLYQEIKKLRIRYKEQYNTEPVITIITHSHGGNVTLNLAKVKDAHDDLSIDRLILLACPVQERNKHCAHDPLFKKVYALYSNTDMIQVLDPQGFKNRDNPKCPFFSGRRFATCTHCTNIKIVYPNRGLLHIDFILPPFLTHLGPILNEISAWEHEHTHDDQWHSIPKCICIDSKKHKLTRKLSQ